jgi:hypothetical protein
MVSSEMLEPAVCRLGREAVRRRCGTAVLEKDTEREGEPTASAMKTGPASASSDEETEGR